MSLINKINKIVPRYVPWGTQLVASFFSEREDFMLAIYFGHFRQINLSKFCYILKMQNFGDINAPGRNIFPRRYLTQVHLKTKQPYFLHYEIPRYLQNICQNLIKESLVYEKCLGTRST